MLTCRTLAADYPSFSKPTKACKSPNFNRDLLADDILELCSEYEKTLTAEQVVAVIQKMNDSYANGLYRFKQQRLSTAVRSKCESGGLWLFCLGRSIDRSYFELVRLGNKK